MTDPDRAAVDLLDDDGVFERLGRRAGAELRQSPPPEGVDAIERSARRRRAAMVSVAAAAAVTFVVAGLFIVSDRREGSPAPAVSLPPPVTSVAITVAPAPPDSIATTVGSVPAATVVPDLAVGTTPGTWRRIPDSPLAPEGFASVVWTGSEAIILGHSTSAEAVPFAVAYDVGADRWRRLVDPPSALLTGVSSGVLPGLQWTGAEVLAATGDGAVYAYDPAGDRWDVRAPAPAAMSAASGDTRLAVARRGVLARSLSGWWWYASADDRWQSVSAPTADSDWSIVEALDDDTIVAGRVDGTTITSAVFETASLTWRIGPAVSGYPLSERQGNATGCDGIDGRLVCFAEGYGTLSGVVIDPLSGSTRRFSLGNHAHSMPVVGIPWLTHAWSLLTPRSASWEDLPPSPVAEVDGFIAAVWTGSEIVFFGGNDGGEPLGLVAAYTPKEVRAHD